MPPAKTPAMMNAVINLWRPVRHLLKRLLSQRSNFYATGRSQDAKPKWKINQILMM